MPNGEALQVFYGTIALILVLAGIWLREQMLLKDILARLGKVEATMLDVVKRLTVLETRAGLIYHGNE